MIFGINTTRDVSNLTAHEITYDNFEISLVVFMPNITTNHAIISILITAYFRPFDNNKSISFSWKKEKQSKTKIRVFRLFISRFLLFKTLQDYFSHI